MRNTVCGMLLVYLVTLVGMLSLSALAKSPPLGWSTACRVVGVHDGDTLTVEITRRVNVRLLDCWSPEIRGVAEAEKARGIKARERLKQLADGKDAVLFIPAAADGDVSDLFTFGRVLGRLYVDGADVSEQMVAAGLATKAKPQP